jgi:biopolymer transport protein ExbD
MQGPFYKQTPLIARINVTPIIDVALVLVIILLITAPMLTVEDLNVNLPKAQTRGAEDEARVTITLGWDGKLALDDKMISLESLPALLRARLSGNKESMLVIVRADQDTPHHIVRSVLSRARDGGAKRLAIATEQKVNVDL